MELGFDKNQATIALLKNVTTYLFRNPIHPKLYSGCLTVEAMSLHLQTY